MVMKRTASVLIVSSLVALPVVAFGRLTDAGDAEISFLALGPAGMKINGTSDDLKVEDTDGKLKFTTHVSSLKTGIGMRDTHLREKYLKGCKEITFKVDRKSLKLPDNDKDVEGSGTGDLTLNCVTKPADFKYKAKRTGSDYHVQAFFKEPVNIKDYNVEVPCFAGVCVDKDVKVKVKFKLRDK
jgi:polyisoprenoid-binding protein YceI